MAVKYVYGIVAASAELPSRDGIGGAPLELVTSDDIAALVSDAPEGDLSMGREAMMTHARVLEDAHALGTVLPMRFGVVMGDGDEVRDGLLAAHAALLTDQLAEFDGKAELRLRATYEEDALLREVVQSDPEIARLRESLRGASEDATYYARIQLGELVAQAVQSRREADADEILAQLSGLALAVDVSEPSHERVVLSASFLVGADQIKPFDDAVDRVGAAQAGRMRIKCIGPLPPHSFVQLAREA